MAVSIAALMPKPLTQTDNAVNELSGVIYNTIYQDNKPKGKQEFNARLECNALANAIAARFCVPLERVCVWTIESFLISGTKEKGCDARTDCGTSFPIFCYPEEVVKKHGPYCWHCGGKIKIEGEG